MSTTTEFKEVNFNDIADEYGFVKKSEVENDYLWLDSKEATAFHEANSHLHVYTLISGSGTSAYLENGWRWANRLAYLFSEKKLDTTNTYCEI